MANRKHLHMSLEDRKFIEKCLDAGIRRNQIALRLGKDKSTVTKEIQKRSEIIPGLYSQERQIKNGEEEVFTDNCRRRDITMGVCNGCSRLNECSNTKRVYDAVAAHEAYDNLLRNCRSGLNLTQERKDQIRQIVREGLEEGLCLQQIHRTRPDLNLSLKSLYNYRIKGLFDDLFTTGAPGEISESHIEKQVVLKARHTSTSS